MVGFWTTLEVRMIFFGSANIRQMRCQFAYKDWVKEFLIGG
jgi:hypothetical protein